MSVFADYLTSMRVDKSQGYTKRFKPAMVAAAIDSIESGEVRDNQIKFDTVLPLFLKRMEALGEPATIVQAVRTYYHLSSDPFWLLCYRDVRQAIPSSDGLTEQKLNAQIKFAMFRLPFWKLLTDSGRRACVLKVLQDRWWPNDMNTLVLNERLLALAVDQNIRPTLVDDGHLANAKDEGYHHQKVIPRAQPHLTRSALEKDEVGSVRKAVGAASNLLSQYEGTWALGFLDKVNPDDARGRFLDLLHGSGGLEDRVRAFHEWAKLRDVAEGERIGFNPTAISYLLGVSAPTKYAFCKPTVYEKAAIALLGSANVPKDKVDRVAHASRFYQAALTLLRDRHGLPFNDLMHSHIAFYLMAYPKNGRPGWDQLDASVPPTQPIMNEHNNLILYGPPGTGKTYHTIHHAVMICDGHAPPDRDALVQRFKVLQDEGRISFVTFHQSYSYEDFVEGIRPIVTNEQSPEDKTSDVQYECRPGVFRMVCEAARGASVGSRVKYEFDPDAVSIWKMSLGNTARSEEAGIFDECIENGYALLGYGRGLDFAGCSSKEEIEGRLRQKEPSIEFSDYEVSAIHWFKNKMKVGDLIVVSDGNWKFRAIGKVTGECERVDRPDDSYSQMRTMEWLFVAEESLPHDRILNRVFSHATIYQLRSHALKRDALRDLLRTTGSTVPKNCVLIIDEINRGNIAKILGELITLLEPDKRLGAPNELQVRLPYSRDLFGVPANLFIVGTMNTADRSIALLDTALRRRFHFREMMPDLDVVRTTVGDHGKLSGVDVAELLETINERVEQLFDRDHQIGHAYVLGVRSLVELRGVFCDKILPLLQEYFYGDWGKVCAVLGCSYDSDTGKPVKGNPRQFRPHALAARGTGLPVSAGHQRLGDALGLPKASTGKARPK